MTTPNPENDIDQLNSFLRGELAAVETYRQCIEKMDDPLVINPLKQLKSSHEKRVGNLSRKVRELGGTPDSDSGAWGSFAKLVEGGAKLLGKSAAISVIEEGEDHGKKTYSDLSNLSPATQAFVSRELIPEQKLTHDILNRLQQQV